MPIADLGVEVRDILVSQEAPAFELTDNWLYRIYASSDVPKRFSAVDPAKALTMTARQYANWKGTFVSTKHSIRRLTPVECERLQTLPDNYTAGVSDAQRYKQLGNGWTVDSICHVLSSINT